MSTYLKLPFVTIGLVFMSNKPLWGPASSLRSRYPSSLADITTLWELYMYIQWLSILFLNNIEYNSVMSSIISSFLHTPLLMAWTITWLSICNVILLLVRFLNHVFNMTTTIYNSRQAIANCLKYALSPVNRMHNYWFPKVAPAPMSLASDHTSMVFAVTHGNGNMHLPLWFVTPCNISSYLYIHLHFIMKIVSWFLPD